MNARGPDHELVIEKPGRHGRDTVTAACVCKFWSVSVCIERQGGVFDPVMSEARARALWAEHEREIPELRRQAATWLKRETELEDLRSGRIRSRGKSEGVLA